jgi:single-strand DNA-binding protein
MNTITSIGRLTRDCESRDAGNTTVHTFAVASNRKVKGDDVPTFLECKAFGKTGEIIAEHHRKGDMIAVTGDLEQEWWDDKQSGERRSKYVVNVRTFTFVKQRSEGGESKPAYSGGGAKSTPNYDPPPKVDEDSLPF